MLSLPFFSYTGITSSPSLRYMEKVGLEPDGVLQATKGEKELAAQFASSLANADFN